MAFDLVGAVGLTACALVVLFGVAFGIGASARERLAIVLVLGAWLMLVITAGATQILHSVPGATTAERLAAVWRLGLTIILPIVIFGTAALKVARLREGLLRTPVWLFVALNATRILGVCFLILYVAGRLPAPFAPVAGWGDVFIGLSAVPVAVAAFRSIESSRRLVLVWNGLGLADLVAAIGLGVTYSINHSWHHVGPGTGLMTLLPWILIPTFLVPLLSLTHLAIFYKLLGGQRGRVEGPLPA